MREIWKRETLEIPMRSLLYI